MIAFALFPLAIYFFLLFRFACRRRPTLLSGSEDFMLLAGGLFGLVTFGPGKLIIPLGVFGFWGFASWIFWAAFYFVVVYFIAERLSYRLVVYHCPLMRFLPNLLDLGKRLDPQCRLDGNVFYLPDYGIQCSVSGDSSGGHILLQGVGSAPDRARWRAFRRELSGSCRTLSVPATRVAVVLMGIGIVLLSISLVAFVVELPKILDLCVDYWG